MNLGYNITFTDLYSPIGLQKVDAAFIAYLNSYFPDLSASLLTARKNPDNLTKKEESALIIELAAPLEKFTGVLFNITENIDKLKAEHHRLAPLFSCKRLFVQRRAVKGEYARTLPTADEAERIKDMLKIQVYPSSNNIIEWELAFAGRVNTWLDNEPENQENINLALIYSAWAALSMDGRMKHENGILFKLPEAVDHAHLIPELKMTADNSLKLPHMVQRTGFKLTDNGGSLAEALDNAHYCIVCHKQGKDSCSRGLNDKSGVYKHNAHNVPLKGCPLDEKISEMNLLKAEGNSIGALATVMIDNPLLPATGHRICNDCMKSCIYQKQEPVDIPKLETRNLRDVLSLPYGFEIYSLFTRWNPLNICSPLPKSLSGNKVLIAGQGPAGFTLAHYLLNEGHSVTAIDGLKIEPLDDDFQPIENAADLWEELDTRTPAGFGGVTEYGITVRWDKNFLKIIRLVLQRREHYRLHGGVNLGGNITIDQAFDEYGFDHIALCMGAGRPNLLNVPNFVARGVRTASDFLMTLQLNSPMQDNSIACLHLRMPVLVIGGGLTAIDAATEAKAYYPIMARKFRNRYNDLCQKLGQNEVEKDWSDEERIIARKWLDAAESAGNNCSVKVVYRSALEQSPAYRLNHEELKKGLEEGIEFMPNLTPTEFIVDEYGHISAAKFTDKQGNAVTLPARTIIIAAGTNPNVTLVSEDGKNLSLDGKYLKRRDGYKVITNIRGDGKSISYFGDMHPEYAGNVVKAMASAKHGYKEISMLLNQTPKTQ